MASAIEVRQISKKYRIYRRPGGYVALRDVLANILRRPLNFAEHKVKQALHKEKQEDYWALKDVSFQVQEGEVVGIIGPNGAGKSTLLKILSRITPPTEGEIVLHGKVSSLLEVGTGFHPELTGRENVYLNGAILGMTRKEIEKKFDDIIDFSGVAHFIDTPIKRYSSGMQVRLAFSVAAHLDPDILLVDEVLAVGDAEFQKKCLGKMEQVSKQGRTVVFVSHNMAAVARLCHRVIVLKEGRIAIDTDSTQGISHYLHSVRKTSAERIWDKDKAPGDSVAKLLRVSVLDAHNAVTDIHDIRNSMIVEMEYRIFKPSNPSAIISILNDQETILFCSPEPYREKTLGNYVSRCVIPGNLLPEGEMMIAAEICSSRPEYQRHVLEHDIVSFQVLDKGEPGSVRFGWPKITGVMRPMLQWETKLIAN